MVSFRQISREEWKSGDYRSFAEIYCKSDEILANHSVEFEEYYADGLGKAKTAFFVTSNNKQFAITEYLEPKVPITEIILLNTPETIERDLNEILETLGLSCSDLGFVKKY